MRLEETFVMGDKTFHVKQFPATKAVKIQIDLLDLINKKEDISSEVSSVKSSELSQDTLDRIVTFLSKLDSEKLVSLIKNVLNENDCVVDSNKKPIDIDEEFSGNLFGLYELFVRVVIINYKDFFLQLVSGQLARVVEEVQNYIKS